MLKQLVALLLLAGVFLLPAAAAPPAATDSTYMDDAAAVLSDEHRAAIHTVSDDLYRQTGIQLLVVVVDDLDEDAFNDYGHVLFEERGIGTEDENGALLLISLSNKVSRVFAGGALEDLSSYKITPLKSNRFNVSGSVMGVYRPLVLRIFELEDTLPSPAVSSLLEKGGKTDSEGPFSPGIVIFLLVILLAMGRSVRTSQKYRHKHLRGHVRKPKEFTRSYDEEEQYRDSGIE